MHWMTNGQCAKGDSCSFKHDPNNKHMGKGRGRPSSPTRTPRNDSKGDGKWTVPKMIGTNPSGPNKSCRASISNKENATEDRLATVGIHLRVCISAHFQVESMEINIWTSIKRMVMVRTEKNSGVIAIQIQDTKEFMLTLATHRNRKSYDLS